MRQRKDGVFLIRESESSPGKINLELIHDGLVLEHYCNELVN